MMNNENRKMTMNDIVSMVQSSTRLKKDDIRKCLHGFLSAISRSIDERNTVAFPDFGAFTTKEVKERSYTLPDKRKVVSPKHTVVRFRPYKSFTSYYIKNQL